ncbi:Uncharacterised protein [Serratia fonticola]|uniref:Uncharacterized protein n=1 Tax=Serratia fonticola TaxID=47917 RepID=A0A448SSZ0_SERFO|nr:Uncharacterised protein [Serratia fonticola]
MEYTPDLLKCITAFLQLANNFVLCVLQYLRNKAAKR